MITKSGLPTCKAGDKISISRASFYRWRNLKDKPDPDAGIRSLMQEIALEFPKYGYRRMTRELQRREFKANHKRVLRIMKEKNLFVKRKKFKPKTTQSNHGLPKYPNLIQDFPPTKVNQVFVSDITYIRLLYGFVYLAVIMDLFSRRCIGWGS